MGNAIVSQQPIEVSGDRTAYLDLSQMVIEAAVSVNAITAIKVSQVDTEIAAQKPPSVSVTQLFLEVAYRPEGPRQSQFLAEVAAQGASHTNAILSAIEAEIAGQKPPAIIVSGIEGEVTAWNSNHKAIYSQIASEANGDARGIMRLVFSQIAAEVACIVNPNGVFGTRNCIPPWTFVEFMIDPSGMTALDPTTDVVTFTGHTITPASVTISDPDDATFNVSSPEPN